MTKQQTFLFLGCGNMGAAIIGGVLKALPDARIIAVDPDGARARSLLPPGAAVEIRGSLTDLEPGSVGAVILGIKPQVFATLDPEIVGWLGQHLVVSIMAGITLDKLQENLGSRRVIRVMPNLPALVGKGMSLGCSATTGAVSDDDRNLAAAIFESVGEFAWAMDENAFERAAPIFGCGPGFIFAIAEQMISAAQASGIPLDLADALVRQTFLGSATMLATDSRSARALKQAVTSPNGTTQAGLAPLEAPEALPAIIPEVYAAAFDRAMELAQQGNS